MKLITWNTQWCRGLDGLVSPKRIIEHARGMADFDVLCLQEISQGFDGMAGAPGDQPAQIEALLPGFQVFFGPAVHEFDEQGRPQRFGNLVATRLAVSRVQHHLLPWPSDPDVGSMPRLCTSLTLRSPELGAVRVMTTHLEYYSASQRAAQADAIRALHVEACAQAAAPPRPELPADLGTPFQPKLHTQEAILCGDFNMPPTDPAYAALQQPFTLKDGSQHQLHDAWREQYGQQAPHAPTFRLYDRRYGPDPVACDFVFLSGGLVPRLARIDVDGATQVSDHQPVLVELR